MAGSFSRKHKEWVSLTLLVDIETDVDRELQNRLLEIEDDDQRQFRKMLQNRQFEYRDLHYMGSRGI